jgi:acyl carrier protein
LTRDDVRAFISQYFSEQLRAQGRSFATDGITDDRDLLLSGLIDSLGLLELMVALSEFAGRELDFEQLDPEEMTVVGSLCDFVVEQSSKPA